MILSFVLFVITFVLLGTASIHEFYPLILVSRSLNGVAVGLCIPAAQIYVSECSSPEIRGILGSLPAMFMAVGISLTYLLGAFLPWDYLSYCCAIAPALGC